MYRTRPIIMQSTNIASLIGLLTIPFSSAVQAETEKAYQLNPGSKAIAFRVSGDRDINTRHYINKDFAVLLGGALRGNDSNHKDASVYSYNNGIEDITVITEYQIESENQDYILYTGVRNHMVSGRTNLFLDTILELIYRDRDFSLFRRRTETNFSPEIDRDKSNRSGTGAGLRVSFGAEYFIYPQFSIEGKIDARFEYIDEEGEEEEELNRNLPAIETSAIDKSFQVYTSGVSLNYYW